MQPWTLPCGSLLRLCPGGLGLRRQPAGKTPRRRGTHSRRSTPDGQKHAHPRVAPRTTLATGTKDQAYSDTLKAKPMTLEATTKNKTMDRVLGKCSGNLFRHSLQAKSPDKVFGQRLRARSSCKFFGHNLRAKWPGKAFGQSLLAKSLGKLFGQAHLDISSGKLFCQALLGRHACMHGHCPADPSCGSVPRDPAYGGTLRAQLHYAKEAIAKNVP